MITLATKLGNESDAADLVEYFNARGNGKNPNTYWGLVNGYPYKGGPLVKQANYYVYELYNGAGSVACPAPAT